MPHAIAPTGSPLFAILFVTAAVIMALCTLSSCTLTPARADEAPSPKYVLVATLETGPHDNTPLVGPLTYRGHPPFNSKAECEAYEQTDAFAQDLLQLVSAIAPKLAENPGAILDVSCVAPGDPV